MVAFNVVRFRVKPGRADEFVAFHRRAAPAMRGFRGGSLIKTGERSYCFIGEWTSFQKIVDARPKMIGMLDEMRGILDDLGGGLGVTDPISGDVVVTMRSQKPRARRPAGRKPKARKAKRRTRR
jgi:hypothetical protein